MITAHAAQLEQFCPTLPAIALSCPVEFKDDKTVSLGAMSPPISSSPPCCLHLMPPVPGVVFLPNADTGTFVLIVFGAFTLTPLFLSFLKFLVTCIPRWLDYHHTWLMGLEKRPGPCVDEKTQTTIIEYGRWAASSFLLRISHIDCLLRCLDLVIEAQSMLGKTCFPCCRSSVRKTVWKAIKAVKAAKKTIAVRIFAENHWQI